jgi:chromate reductase, NAD(P)H dehydrogenase (quinone)
MRVLGIAGSLRRDSHNRKLLRAAAYALPPEWELVEWSGLGEVPAFDEDLEGGNVPAAVQALRDAIDDADAVLIATPEYNASVPGALKNALDWASRPFETNVFRGKPVLVIGASTGLFGAVWAQAEVRKALKFMKAHVLEEELPIGMADAAFALNGALVDPAAGDRLAELLHALIREVDSPVESA